MPATEYGAPTSALAVQLAAEEEARRKERERYAAAMGVDPSAVGTSQYGPLINQIRGPAPRVVTNLLGGNNIAPPPMATEQKPGMFKKFGPLLGMLPMLLR